jgi:hypothetical protein
VLNPRDRVPVSLIIDDSTCLVNLAHFCIPQFQEVFPDQYRQPWRTLPREIPDAFVRKFAAWCHEHGIQGKYSLIPYPACVGWLDRDLPGWSRRELEASLDLVRTMVMPGWDLHPEIVSHTWVVDTRMGRPYPQRTADYMENWGWSVGKSADQLGDYFSYALRILANVGVSCTGITTPGGFGVRALPELAEATLQSCRDVFRVEIPHYYRHAFTDERSVAPRVEYASGLDGPDPRCVVSMEVVRRLHAAYDDLIWMKLSAIARYWAARELTRIERAGRGQLDLKAPFACPDFTVGIDRPESSGTGPDREFAPAKVRLSMEGRTVALAPAAKPHRLDAGTFSDRGRDVIACFDLPRGASRLVLELAAISRARPDASLGSSRFFAPLALR